MQDSCAHGCKSSTAILAVTLEHHKFAKDLSRPGRQGVHPLLQEPLGLHKAAQEEGPCLKSALGGAKASLTSSHNKPICASHTTTMKKI